MVILKKEPLYETLKIYYGIQDWYKPRFKKS
jgi:hypothetical protein